MSWKRLSCIQVPSLLRRSLSPRAFEFVRFRWWWLSAYFPRLVASRFFKRTAKVRSFNRDDTESHLVKELESVNVLAPTKMCFVMTKHGSDKGCWHNYTTVYSVLFKECRDQPLRFFELGLGTNNPHMASSMGINGKPGASLRGWRELFPQALVYGADIDRDTLFQEDRIKSFYCDQLDQAVIRELWSHPDLRGGVDIVIEDGLHTVEANVSFLDGSLEHLRPGGIYVIEDIDRGKLDEWFDLLETTYSKRYPTYEFALVALPAISAAGDNNLLIIKRNA
jgi:SAM-dependent methyltransferase